LLHRERAMMDNHAARAKRKLILISEKVRWMVMPDPTRGYAARSNKQTEGGQTCDDVCTHMATHQRDQR
jgi:hypothetical protein